MKLNKHEQDALNFAKRHPNEWHTFKTDKTTFRAVAVLYLLKLVQVNEFGQFGYFTDK